MGSKRMKKDAQKVSQLVAKGLCLRRSIPFHYPRQGGHIPIISFFYSPFAYFTSFLEAWQKRVQALVIHGQNNVKSSDCKGVVIFRTDAQYQNLNLWFLNLLQLFFEEALQVRDVTNWNLQKSQRVVSQSIAFSSGERWGINHPPVILLSFQQRKD